MIGFLLLAVGCPQPKPDTGDDPALTCEELSAALATEEAAIRTCTEAGLPDCHASDGFATEVASASVTGDTLTLTVSYGGGCETHEFALCWPDGAFMESDPVQVALELWHGGPPDACDAWITEDRTFDLTPLKEAWQAAYQQTSGTIVVHVAGQTVDYTF